MKIQLYCDVFMVPPVKLVKAGKEKVEIVRFVKTVSMPTLLVPGQTYQMECDPVIDNFDPSDFKIVDSGVLEEKGKQIPYMVVKDDYWLAFEPWLQEENDADGLSFDQLVALWREEDEQSLEEVKSRFKESGWLICTLRDRQPPESQPNLEYT